MHRLVALITVAAALVHAPQASAQSTPGLPPAPSSTPGLPPDPAPTPGLPGASTPAPVAPPQVLSASGQVEATIDFAALGLMSSIAIIDARDIGNQNTGTLLVFGGVLGGGAAGYLLTEKFRSPRGKPTSARPR